MGKTIKTTLRQAFPKTIQKLVSQVVEQESYNEEYLLVSMLSATASAAGNAVQLRVKGKWKTSPSLYAIIVGDPGMGKTPPLNFAYAPIRRQDEKLRRQFYEKLASMENDRKRQNSSLLLTLQRTIVSDFTPEALIQAHGMNPRGIAIYVDEMMGMFNSVNQYNKGQLIEQLLTAYSGNPLDVMRVSQERPIHIEHPCINIIGTVQTMLIKELFNMGFQKNGLLDRFLFSYPKESSPSYWNIKKGKKEDDTVSEQWQTILEKVLSLGFSEEKSEHHLLNFSAQARKTFFDWHDDGVKAIAQGKVNAREQGRMMKTHLNVARIALCIQVLRWACNEGKLDTVDVTSIRSAISISDYFEECYQRVGIYVKQHCMSPHLQMFVRSLKKEFSTAEAMKHGDEMGMNPRNVKYTLTKLQRMEVIRKVRHGRYMKCDEFKDI